MSSKTLPLPTVTVSTEIVLFILILRIPLLIVRLSADFDFPFLMVQFQLSISYFLIDGQMTEFATKMSHPPAKCPRYLPGGETYEGGGVKLEIVARQLRVRVFVVRTFTELTI